MKQRVLSGPRKRAWRIRYPRRRALPMLQPILKTRAILTTMVFYLLSATAFAAENSAGHHEAHVTNWFMPWGEVNTHAPALGWVILMFGIFVGAIYYFSRRPFKTMLENRHEEMKNALEQASKAKAEAEAKKSEYDERLRGLDGEIEKIKAEFEARGEKEKKRLEKLGRATAERIQKDVVDTIAAEQARAEKELRLEAARLAVDLAEKKVQKVMNDDDELRIKNEFLRELSH